MVRISNTMQLTAYAICPGCGEVHRAGAGCPLCHGDVAGTVTPGRTAAPATPRPPRPNPERNHARMLAVLSIVLVLGTSLLVTLHAT